MKPMHDLFPIPPGRSRRSPTIARLTLRCFGCATKIRVIYHTRNRGWLHEPGYGEIALVYDDQQGGGIRPGGSATFTQA
jgi:hypothetical protein